MSEQRFTIEESENQLIIFDNGVSDETYFHLGDDERDVKYVCDLLNEQQDTIQELQQKYDKLCIEMANIYSKYIFMKEFSEDTNPNEAVKYVLRELMQKTKEARR